MGKASKKMVKNHLRNKQAEEHKGIDSLKKEARDLIVAEQYAEVINIMVQAAEKKYYDPDLMYDTAFAYFMLGDYERAANWINNALTYAPDHLMARILLARLCILEERTEDGLAIFDFVLDKWKDALDEPLQEELREILEYYGRNEEEKLRLHYPHIAEFLHVAGELELPAGEETVQAQQQAVVREVQGKAEEESPLAKAQAAIAAMHRMMEQASPADTVAAVPEMVNEADNTIDDKEDNSSEADNLEDIEGVKTNILAKDVSVVEKIQLLNSFAGAYYYKENFSACEVLLTTALSLDAHHEETLRNAVYLSVAQGRQDEALQYASQLKMMDFGLLEHIKGSLQE